MKPDTSQQLSLNPFLYPATALLVLASIGLYAAFVTRIRSESQPRAEARVALGAVSQEKVRERILRERRGTPQESRADLPPADFRAPLRLWDGQWWRITVSAFHHAGFVHLFTNCLVLVVFGLMLERRVGSLFFLVFFLVATTASLIPCFLINVNTVGLSGGISALFGLMIVVRDHDEELQQALPLHVFVVGLLSLFAGFLLSALELWRVSNLAHFSGLIYGWLAAWAWFADSPARRLGRIGFIGLNLLLIPAVYYTVHPFWNSDYQRLRAWQATDPLRQIMHLKEAVRWNPQSAAAWEELAQAQLKQGDVIESWRAAVHGFYHNRTRLRPRLFAAFVFSRLRTPQERKQANTIFRQVFGDEADDWDEQLALLTRPRRDENLVKRSRPPASFQPRSFDPRLPPWTVRRGGVDLFWNHVDSGMTRYGRLMQPPQVDPDDPRSALLGLPM